MRKEGGRWQGGQRVTSARFSMNEVGELEATHLTATSLQASQSRSL